MSTDKWDKKENCFMLSLLKKKKKKKKKIAK